MTTAPPTYHRLKNTRRLCPATTCPVCGSPDLVVLRQRDFAAGDQLCQFGLLEPGDRIDDTACRACAMIFKNPRFADETLTEYYRDVCPANEVYWRPPDADTNPAYEANERWRFATNAYWLRGWLGRPPRVVTDIGGQDGAALRPFVEADAGVEAVVVDPGFEARRHKAVPGVRGYPSIQAAQADSLQADLAMSLHTLEHVSDPVGFVAAMLGLLARPHGRLYLEVPYDLLQAEHLFDASLPMPTAFHAEHINFFSRGSLAALADAVGAPVVWIGLRMPVFRWGGFSQSLGMVLRPPPADVPHDVYRRPANAIHAPVNSASPAQPLDTLRAEIASDHRRSRWLVRWQFLKRRWGILW